MLINNKNFILLQTVLKVIHIVNAYLSKHKQKIRYEKFFSDRHNTSHVTISYAIIAHA